MARRLTRRGVRAIRKSLGLTRQELAERLGVRYWTIWAWETGFRKPDGLASAALRMLCELERLREECERKKRRSKR